VAALHKLHTGHLRRLENVEALRQQRKEQNMTAN